MRDLREYFLPYQIRWIRSPHPIEIAEKSRRIGWTYASAYRAVERRTILGTDLFYSSADLSAAREFVEECQQWAKVFRIVATDLGQQVIDEREGLSAFVLRFENGAKIMAGSSNPKFFRGKGGDADGDEFAFHAQPRELYKAMQPAALIWGHQMRLWSTHNGEHSFFNKLLQDAREAERKGSGLAAQRAADAGSDAPGAANDARDGAQRDIGAENEAAPVTGQRVHVSRVTLLDAVQAGLVEKIRGLPRIDPAARAEFIAEIRASCIDEDAWNEEYLCTPSSGQNALLSYPIIEGCETANLTLWDVGQFKRDGVAEWSSDGGDQAAPDEPAARHSITRPPDHSATAFYAGFDVGRKHDRSVLWVLERVGDVLWTRVLRVLQDVTFTAQEELLDLLLRDRRVRRLCIDSTGIGAMLAERLKHRWSHRAEGVHFTLKSKSDLASPMVRLFQDKLIRIPSDPAVREDLHKVRKVSTAGRHARYDAQRDEEGHADRFWAMALAVHAAESEPAPLRTAVRKPVGW